VTSLEEIIVQIEDWYSSYLIVQIED